MAHALVHILGSRSGYTTLDATAGLTSGDRAELEVLGFGDATSSEAMARLETHACMVGRRLRSGRFAISRMLPGGTDDKGRPTIEVVSLVLDASGYAAVAGAFARLADDVRFWRLARGAVARGYELPEQAPVESAREPGVLRAFDTWVAARKTGSIGVLAAQDAQSLLAMVALLDGQDLGECRWGVGVVSLSAPVDICTLAPATAAIGSRPVLRAATGESWLSPEMAHVEFHVAQNPLLPQRASLVSAVHIEPALDRDAEATPVAAAPRASASWRPSSPKRNLTMIAAITASASLAVLVMTTAVYVRTGRAVNVTFTSQSGQEGPSTPSVVAGGDASLRRQGASGYETLATPTPAPVPAISPAAESPHATDRDGDRLADDEDPCPNDANFVKVAFFLDSDGDGHGSAASAEHFFCVASDTTAKEDGGLKYSRDKLDHCDDDPSRFALADFYISADGDKYGCADCPPRQFCCKDPGDVWETIERDGARWVRNQRDRCDKNDLREDPGVCGCDWRAREDLDLDRDELKDCQNDDDGDGKLNWEDGPSTDSRLEFFRARFASEEPEKSGERTGYFGRARDALERAEAELKSLEEARRKKGGGRRDLLKAGWIDQAAEDSIDSFRASIETSLREIYEARCAAVFGIATPLVKGINGAPPQDILAVTRVGPEEDAAGKTVSKPVVDGADYRDFLYVAERIGPVTARLLQFEAMRAGAAGAEKQAVRKVKLRQDWETRYGSDFQSSIADWVLDFIDWTKADTAGAEVLKLRKTLAAQIKSHAVPRQRQAGQ